MKFVVHTVDTAPAASRATLEKISERYGFVPNLAGVFAESPGAMNGLLASLAAFDSPEFELTELERQVVLLAVSVRNRCAYCAAAHSMLAHNLGLDQGEVTRLQQGKALSDSRLQSLRRFVEHVVESQGWLTEDELDAFAQAGFTQAHVLELVYGIAVKTLTNFVNHIAQPPVNAQFADYLPDWAGAAA